MTDSEPPDYDDLPETAPMDVVSLDAYRASRSQRAEYTDARLREYERSEWAVSAVLALWRGRGMRDEPFRARELYEHHGSDIARAAHDLASCRRRAVSTLGDCVPSEREVWVAAQAIADALPGEVLVPGREALASMCRAAGLMVV